MSSPPNPSQPTASSAIRAASRADLPALKALIDANGLFPSSMLDEMMAAYLNNSPGCAEIWLTSETHSAGGADSVLTTIAYCGPERMTSGTWNLFLIAVLPSLHSRGLGAAMMAHVESLLAARGERVLLVETSGLPQFERTRAFYRRLGYTEEARIREFYQAGEDKVVFWKALRVVG